MVAQTARPMKWVIVNDGSTDSTPAIIDRYAATHKWIERLDMPSHRDRSFAAKAHCVNAAWKSLAELQFEVIGNIDADVSFEPDYLEFLLKKFLEMPELGVAGTPLQAEGGYDTSKDSFEGENYVAGPCQLFRRACLEDVGRLRSQQGWRRRLDRRDNRADERMEDAFISGEAILSSSQFWNRRPWPAGSPVFLRRKGLLPRGKSSMGDLSCRISFSETAGFVRRSGPWPGLSFRGDQESSKTGLS